MCPGKELPFVMLSGSRLNVFCGEMPAKHLVVGVSKQLPNPRGGMRRARNLAAIGIMGAVARQAKTVLLLVHNSLFASLLLVRRDVINGSGGGAER